MEAWLRKDLDEAEKCSPQRPQVETGRECSFQLVEDLIHFEGRENGLDQNGSRGWVPRGDADVFLTEKEDIIPEARFEMALHLSGR